MLRAIWQKSDIMLENLFAANAVAMELQMRVFLGGNNKSTIIM